MVAYTIHHKFLAYKPGFTEKPGLDLLAPGKRKSALRVTRTEGRFRGTTLVGGLKARNWKLTACPLCAVTGSPVTPYTWNPVSSFQKPASRFKRQTPRRPSAALTSWGGLQPVTPSLWRRLYRLLLRFNVSVLFSGAHYTRHCAGCQPPGTRRRRSVITSTRSARRPEPSGS